MEILVKIGNNYGNEVIYPICDDAQVFASIAKAKTLTAETIAAIKRLGYKINVEQRSI